jgi:hypothetical protein
LARKGLKETKFFPAKRAGKQSSVGHWINSFLDAPRHATKFIVLHLRLQQIPAFSAQELARLMPADCVAIRMRGIKTGIHHPPRNRGGGSPN